MVSPVLARPVVLDRTETATGLTAHTTCRIEPDEPVFEGHYPDFPIFPGVLIVECIRAGAEAVSPAEGLRLRAVESVRFSSPVLPGDEVRVELTWTAQGGTWRCKAVASTERGRAASAKLRYEGDAA